MSHAMLPAGRVKDAAGKALADLERERGTDETQDDQKRRWLSGLIGLCRAVLADPKGDHDIAVEANDFTWIMKHYDFTDPRVIVQHEHTSTARAFGKE